ncbi:hypothetical protein JNJ66_02865 [Candidatus Saccharibacteria bacterium]|nr:hypothetical protein [Candidatus Saccharibacteria bacterium]
MALFVKQTEERTKLQEKLAAELQERAKRTQQMGGGQPDTLDDSSYLKDTKDASPLTAVWIVIVILALVVLGVFMFVNRG